MESIVGEERAEIVGQDYVPICRRRRKTANDEMAVIVGSGGGGGGQRGTALPWATNVTIGSDRIRRGGVTGGTHVLRRGRQTSEEEKRTDGLRVDVVVATIVGRLVAVGVDKWAKGVENVTYRTVTVFSMMR